MGLSHSIIIKMKPTNNGNTPISRAGDKPLDFNNMLIFEGTTRDVLEIINNSEPKDTILWNDKLNIVINLSEIKRQGRQETINEKELELLIFIYNRLAHLEGGYDLDYIIKLGKLLEKLQEMRK